MTIAKKLVEAHEGGIEVVKGYETSEEEIEEEMEGACFRIVLPVG